MLDTYNMAPVNLILSVIVFTASLFYRHIYPKKKINLFLLLIIISILPVISIFRFGAYESGDFNIHVYRTISFYQNLSEGNFMPSWAGELNATYGYPAFIFLNPLIYYIQSLFHFFGFSFTTSMKLFLAISFILSGAFYYMWVKSEMKNSLSAFTGAIFYLFAPYHLVALHFKVTAGELIFFTFLPLYFYTINKFINTYTNFRWLLFSSLSFSIMMFSHQALTAFSIPLIIFYIFYKNKTLYGSTKAITLSFSTIILGMSISLYSWLPHVILTKYTLAHILSSNTVSFPQFYELFLSPWRYGMLFQGPKGELSYLIGYTQIGVIIISIITLIKKTAGKYASDLLLWVSISIILIFMMTPISSFIWNSLPILNTAQFSTRLLVLLIFCISFIAAIITHRFKNKTFLTTILIVFTIGYTILNWGTRKVVPKFRDSTFIENLSKSTAEAEGLTFMGQPKWIYPNIKWYFKIPKNHLEVIKGDAKIQESVRKNEYHSYVIFSRNGFTAKENTWYFPEWKVYIDKKQVPINYVRTEYPGIMTFQVPAGLHYITTKYEDPPELKTAKIASFTLMLSFVGFLFFSLIHKMPFYLRRYIINLLPAHTWKKGKGQT